MRAKQAALVLLGLLLGGPVAARRKDQPPISGVGNADGDPNKASGERGGGGGGGDGAVIWAGIEFRLFC